MKNFLLKTGDMWSYSSRNKFRPVIVKAEGVSQGRIEVPGYELHKHFRESFRNDDWLYVFHDFLEIPDDAIPDENFPLLVEVDESLSKYYFTGNGVKIAKATAKHLENDPELGIYYDVYYRESGFSGGWTFDLDAVTVLLDTTETLRKDLINSPTENLTGEKEMNELVEVMLLGTGGYSAFKEDTKFPVKVLAKLEDQLYRIPVSELCKVGYDLSLQGAAKGVDLTFWLRDCVPVEDISATAIYKLNEKSLTPKPRFRKKRIAPPVRKKTDVVITYRDLSEYTLKNVTEVSANINNFLSVETSDGFVVNTSSVPLSGVWVATIKSPNGGMSIATYGGLEDYFVVNDYTKDGVASARCTWFKKTFKVAK